MTDPTIGKDPEPEIFKCAHCEGMFPASEVYYNQLPGEYIAKDHLDEYIRAIGLDEADSASLKSIIINENGNT